MANFSQSAPIQYKEYVAQNPIEAMTMVGMKREQELQTGIQKVNDYYSQVAGVDLLRDVDKQALQNNLNGLKGGVAKTLSGDFSDSRITNQITSAAKRIYKDPQIQNAILSTAKVRKGQLDLEEARKKGENGPANDYQFNLQLSKYLNDPTPEGSFNYSYEKYTNAEKEKFDIVSKLHPSGTLTDDAFHYNEKGERVLNESTIRNGFKGVRPEQIKAALRAGLSPQAWRQMELDGMYQFSNMPDQEFADYTQKSYAEGADTIKDKIKALDKLSTTSASEKTILEQKKADLLRELDSLKNEYEGVTSTFASGNVDAGKAKLYTLRSINHFANATAYGELSSSYVGDTPQQMEKWRQEQNTKIKQFDLKFAQDERFHQENREDKKKELSLKEKELAGFGSLSTPLDKDQIAPMSLERFKSINEGIQAEVDTEKAAFIKSNKYDPNSAEGKAWYDAKHEAFLKGDTKLTTIEREHFQDLEDRIKERDGNLAAITQVIEEADNNKDLKKIKDLIPKDAPSLRYADETGAVIYSPADFVNFNSKMRKGNYSSTTSWQGEGTTPTTIYDFDKAKKELSPKEYKLFEMVASKNNTEAQKTVLREMDKYSRTVNQEYNKEIKKTNDFINAKLAERVLVNQGTLSDIPLPNKASEDAANGLIPQLAEYADKHNGKIGNTTSEDLRKLLKDGNKKFTFERGEPTRYQEGINNLIITSADGTAHRIPLTEEQRQNVFGSEYKATPEQQRFAPIAQQIQKAGGFSTELGPQPFLGKSKFKSVQNYQIEGDVVKGKGGRYMLKLHIIDPISGVFTRNIPYPTQGTLEPDRILQVLDRLDDAAIFQMLSADNKPPTAKDLEALRVAAQKP